MLNIAKYYKPSFEQRKIDIEYYKNKLTKQAIEQPNLKQFEKRKCPICKLELDTTEILEACQYCKLILNNERFNNDTKGI